jgi:hypothetical protein
MKEEGTKPKQFRYYKEVQVFTTEDILRNGRNTYIKNKHISIFCKHKS